jgi:signal transduction histidine kinase
MLENTNHAHQSPPELNIGQFFNDLSDPAFVIDPKTLTICQLNKSALRLKDEINQNDASQFDAEFLTGVSAVDLKAQIAELSSHDRDVVRLEVCHLDFEFDVSLQIMWSSGSEPLLVAIFRDVSARAGVDRKTSELVSTVSHELRSPLTAIKGAMGLILSGAAGDVSVKALQMVEIAQRNADRLILIINDILDLDKIKDGAMVFDNTEIELIETVNDSVEAIVGFRDRFDVQVDVDVQDEGLISNIDPNRIVQVLVNLLSNAIKFSPAGGRVTVQLKLHGQLNRISIIDNGEGIPVSDQKSIFGRFMQVGSKNRAATGGTGLGLSIVKAIVENQVGKISFESQEGVGSTFHVDLPAVVGKVAVKANKSGSD